MGALERANGVLSVVIASTVLTSVSAAVIVSNVLDARPATAPVVATPAPIQPVPQRVYPPREEFDTTVAIGIDRAPIDPPVEEVAVAPIAITAPEAEPAEAPTIAAPPVVEAPAIVTAPAPAPVTIIAGRPPVVPAPRPRGAPATDIVILARGISPEEAVALPRPITRPADRTAVVSASAPIRPAVRPDSVVARAASSPGGFELAFADPVAVFPAPNANIFSTLGDGECTASLTREIPRRPAGADSGSAVMAAVGNGSGSGRDDQLVAQALAGNVPNYMRDLRPVTFTNTVAGRSVEVVICVTPDYLAIGSDSDHVRVPLGLPAALRVADAFDMMLPTTSMVDAIYTQADVRVAPSPMTPTSSMSSTNYFVEHDETVSGQFARAGAQEGMLVAGHKKDLVLANRLSRNPGRVAIYGWHRTNGRAIQPLSTVHGAYYADYSHGVRLVSRTAYVNGNPVDLSELLTDARYASFLNGDGAFNGSVLRLASL